MRWMLTGALALAGCAATQTAVPGGAPMPAEATTITYETSPCFGACPVYSVTVRPDGTGTFEGRRFTAVEGARAFQAGPEAYRRFAAALAPHRPAGERLLQPGQPGCENAPTDMPGVDVRWRDAGGGGAHLVFYGGCRMGNEALAEAVRAAPDALPIAAFIGPRDAFIGRR
jgi:hypothetical protein